MSELSRRDALAIMGMVPLATMLGTTPEAVEHALRAAAQAKLQPSFEPKFFTPHEWQTVRVLVDIIIPRDERSGSATDAAVPEFMDFTMDDRPGMQLQMRGGLAWLDRESLDRFGKPFVQLAVDQQTALLDDIAFPRRARPEMSQGVAFFNYFRDLTAGGFWSSKIGAADIGYMGNTFVPEWNGCPPAAMQRLGVTPDMMKSRVPIQR